MNYYFLGIGGIGMSAIARFLKQQGDQVSGYDRTESPLTQQLVAEGIIPTTRRSYPLMSTW